MFFTKSKLGIPKEKMSVARCKLEIVRNKVRIVINAILLKSQLQDVKIVRNKLGIAKN